MKDMNGKEFKIGQKIKHHNLSSRPNIGIITALDHHATWPSIDVKTDWPYNENFTELHNIEIIEDNQTMGNELKDKNGKAFEVGQRIYSSYCQMGGIVTAIDTLGRKVAFTRDNDGKPDSFSMLNYVEITEDTPQSVLKDKCGKEFKAGQRVKHHNISAPNTAVIDKVDGKGRLLFVTVDSGPSDVAWSELTNIEIIKDAKPVEVPTLPESINLNGFVYELKKAPQPAPEPPKPSGLAVFSPKVQLALSILDDVLASNDKEAGILADALSMLRGPDSTRGDEKIAATVPVRRTLFPQTAKKGGMDKWNFGDDRMTTINTSLKFKDTHYADHAAKAKAGLNL